MTVDGDVGSLSAPGVDGDQVVEGAESQQTL
jgi:hypothetical protein